MTFGKPGISILARVMVMVGNLDAALHCIDVDVDILSFLTICALAATVDAWCEREVLGFFIAQQTRTLIRGV